MAVVRWLAWFFAARLLFVAALAVVVWTGILLWSAIDLAAQGKAIGFGVLALIGIVVAGGYVGFRELKKRRS